MTKCNWVEIYYFDHDIVWSHKKGKAGKNKRSSSS